MRKSGAGTERGAGAHAFSGNCNGREADGAQTQHNGGRESMWIGRRGHRLCEMARGRAGAFESGGIRGTCDHLMSSPRMS